jgi:hypothetical protein
VGKIVEVIHNYHGVTPCNTTLQACIDGSRDGDEIHIATGTYITSLTLYKPVSLLGDAGDTPVLKALPNHGYLPDGAPSLTCCGGGFQLVNGAQPFIQNIVLTNKFAFEDLLLTFDKLMSR